MNHAQWVLLIATIMAAATAAGTAAGQAVSQDGVVPSNGYGAALSATLDRTDPLFAAPLDSTHELLTATLVLEASLKDTKTETLGEAADTFKAVEGFRSALTADIEQAGEGGFSLVRSHTLEQIGRFGIEKMPEIVDHLRASGKLKKSFAVPDLAWAGDLVDAIHEDIKETGESPWVFVKSHTLGAIGKIGLEGMPAAVKWLQVNKKLPESFQVPNLEWTADFFKAVGQDIEKSGDGGFVLWRSHTLEQSARILLDKMPAMVTTLQKAGMLPATYSLPFLSGAMDISTASGKYLGSGHADIETTALFWDGINKTMWSIAGSLWGGEKGAEVSQAFGDAAAKLGRELAQPVFNKAVLLGSGQGRKLFADWQTLQRKRVQLGLPVQSMIEMYGEDLLRKNGFARHAIKAMETPFVGSVTSLESQQRKADIQLYWTDTGITPLGRPSPSLVHMGNDFIPVFDVAEEGRIILRMPVMKDGKGKERYLTDAEWQSFENTLTKDLLQRLTQLTQEKGVKDIEIRTVQDINIFGYNDPRRQEEVRLFTRSFLRALDTVRQAMEKKESLACFAATGSNGVHAAAQVISEMKREGKTPPIEFILSIDGRASERDMERLIEAMDQKVLIVNTAGDAPTSPRALFIDMVASLECSKRLKAKYPGIRVVFVSDPFGVAGLPTKFRHVEMMQGNNVGVIKEYDGKDFHLLGVMQARTFAGDAVGVVGGGKQESMVGDTARPFFSDKINKVAGKKRDDAFPPFQQPFYLFFLPPPPPPPPGVGGIAITPEPILSGKTYGKAAEDTLGARPSADSLSWSIPSSIRQK